VNAWELPMRSPMATRVSNGTTLEFLTSLVLLVAPIIPHQMVRALLVCQEMALENRCHLNLLVVALLTSFQWKPSTVARHRVHSPSMDTEKANLLLLMIWT